MQGGFTVARIRYPNLIDDERRSLAERIKRERGGRLLNLYKLLLHSPPVAEGWLAFFTAIRQKAGLDARYRELAILRVAVINRAEYEFAAHVPFALEAGFSQAELDALRADVVPGTLTAEDRAVIAYTDAMTQAIRVPEEVFAELLRHFREPEVVELTATIAAYNCVSRFLEALHVDPE
jgi:AhpD family alkylhydroperoxidase